MPIINAKEKASSMETLGLFCFKMINPKLFIIDVGIYAISIQRFGK